jgi:hypothetical protein
MNRITCYKGLEGFPVLPQAMKKSAKIFRSLLALLMFGQGVSLVATCAVPCNMSPSEKVGCVVDSILSCQHAMEQKHGGAIRSTATACGHLEITAPVATFSLTKTVLSAPSSNSVVMILPPTTGTTVAEVKSMGFDRAGPSGSGPKSALLAVPPQNAPPVLV